MNLRFSLRSLVVFTGFAALACAALTRPGPGWLSLIVSCTAVAAGVQILRAILLDGERRAAALGWLLFAGAYLALFSGPWLGQHLGPQLLTSRGVAVAQQRLQQGVVLDSYDPPVGLDGNQWIDPGYLNVSSSSLTLMVAGRFDTAAASSAGLFSLSAHWLFVWIAATAGSMLAAGLSRRQQRAVPSPPAAIVA